MKINLAKSAGFCFGVKRALKIALETAKSNTKVYILGDIVHNEDVSKQIKEAGIKKIKNLSDGKNKILILRAHGTSLDTIKTIRECGYRIIDATCPMVKGIHKIANDMERKGYRIIIIGDKFHDEVLGIIGQLKFKAIVIENKEHIPFQRIKKIKKAAVVVQSTQNLEKVLNIIGILKSHIKDLKFANTICKPTRIKQEEIKKMPKHNDVMLIIGSKNSANTKRLYEISKSLNKRSYWIQLRKDIKKDWIKDTESIGITAGASTPDSTTEDVIAYVTQIN